MGNSPDKFLQMPLEKKRQLYKMKYVTLDMVPTWEEYVKKNLNDSATSDGQRSISDLDKKLAQKLSLWSGDITSLEIDAITNAANSRLLGGGGVDGAIHNAAGKYLLSECKTLNGCPEGEAKITCGYLLPAKHVIHTVGPQGEHPDTLASCYRNSLLLATHHHLRTIAFPCISTGVYGYPPAAAAKVACETVKKHLEENHDDFDRIIFCVFLKSDLKIYEEQLMKLIPVA